MDRLILSLGVLLLALGAQSAAAEEPQFQSELPLPPFSTYRPGTCLTKEWLTFWDALKVGEPAMSKALTKSERMRRLVEGNEVSTVKDCDFAPADLGFHPTIYFQRNAFNSYWDVEREGGDTRQEYHGYRYYWFTQVPQGKTVRDVLPTDKVTRRLLSFEVCRNRSACDQMGLFNIEPTPYSGPVAYTAQKSCSNFVKTKLLTDLETIEPAIASGRASTLQSIQEFENGQFDGRNYKKESEKCFVQSLQGDGAAPSSLRRILLSSYHVAPGDRIEGREGPAFEHVEGMSIDYRYVCSPEEISLGSPDCKYKEIIALRICRSKEICEALGITKEDPKLPEPTAPPRT